MTPDEIRAARDALGMTQAALAEALSVDGKVAPVTISRWETGLRTPPPFLRLALERLAGK